MSSASYDFALFLVLATFFTGVFWGVEQILKKKQKGVPRSVQFFASFFMVFFLVLCLRSFIFEPFRIPTGSMKPTLLDGDFVLVNKFIYGIRLPVTNTKIIPFKKPKRGDILIFQYPVNPKVPFIKRVIGLPGDKIEYKDKVLYINGEKISQIFQSADVDMEQNGAWWPVERYKTELMPDFSHDIFLQKPKGREQDEIMVPENHYFVMGDNRDNSEDSRVWGFVGDEHLIGRALLVWMSWDGFMNKVRFDRIGLKANQP